MKANNNINIISWESRTCSQSQQTCKPDGTHSSVLFTGDVIEPRRTNDWFICWKSFINIVRFECLIYNSLTMFGILVFIGSDHVFRTIWDEILEKISLIFTLVAINSHGGKSLRDRLPLNYFNLYSWF